MKNSILTLASAIIIGLTFSSCSNNEANTIPTAEEANYKQVLKDISINVITETYKDLNDKAVLMTTAASNFTIGDEAELTALKNAWIATRSPWEKSEGFLFGPVDSEGIDPAIDAWPVDVTAINSIIASSATISSSSLDAINNEAKGFHTLEYFIWGLNANKTAAQFTSREVEYILAAAQNLQSKTLQLFTSWQPEGKNYADNFINPGSTKAVKSQIEGLAEFVQGIVLIADEVAITKIEEPLNGNNGAAKPEVEESRFSNNSKLDFADNIRSIQNIYLADYSTFNGKGLTDIVSSKNAALDSEIKIKITAAINAIENIPGTFTNAIVNSRPAVQNAQSKVAELKVVLDTKLLPLISNL